jgi:flavodoxin
MMMSTGKALAGGDPLSVYVGGLTGGGGMVGKIAEAEAKQAKATEAIREKPGLKDKERLDQEKVVIQTMYKEIQAVYEKGVKDVTATLKDANDTALKERLGGAKANFEKQVAFYKDQIRNTSLAETKSELDLARQNALQDRPFENRMALLNAELAKAQGKLGAVGQGQEMQDLAKATGLWGIAIVEVNKQIGALKPKLTETQEAQIKLVYTDLVAVESEEKWRAHVQASTVASNDRIASLKLLSDSIGQGYEATKKFNVETGVMTFIQEHAADATFLLTHQKDIAAERTRLGIEFELKFGAQIKETTDKLKDQIAVDKAVTDVINQGSYAMRNAALEAEIRRMEEHKLTDEQKQQIIVMRQKFAAQEAMATGEEIVKLTRQVQEIDAVTDAIRKGAEAERKAKNEAKYAEMEQAHPGTSDFERTKDSKQHYQDLLRDATRITQEHKNRIETIDQELVVLELERALGADEVETLIQERNLNNERLEQQSKLNLLHGKAIDGLRAFVQEMKATMKTPAQIMYESMVDAMGKLADEFTKLITHQKVSFKKMFQDLGASVVRNLIMEGLKHAITIIFPKLAGAQKGSDTDPMVTRPKTGQPDGTPQSPFCVIVMDTPAAPVGGNTPPAPDKVRAGLAGLLGSIGAVLLGSIKLPAKGGGKAEGGEVSPGSAYVVGERGPEPFFPKVSGQVMSNAMAQKTFGGGGGHTYFMSIDARGTDPVLTEQRVYRAIREAHRDAIGSSVQATVLRTARVPAGK